MSLKSFKTQLDPTTTQTESFVTWAHARTGVFNWARSMRKAAWDRYGVRHSRTDLDGMATDKKNRGGFGFDVHSPPRRVLFYAIKDCDRAFQNFFRRANKQGKKPGYPKRKYKGDDMRFSVYGSDCKYFEDAIGLPCLENPVSYEETGYVPTDADKYSRVTVSKDEDRWMVSVQCHVEMPIDPDRLRPEEERPAAVAVHPGVRVWLASQTLPREGAKRSMETHALPMDRIFELWSRQDRQHKALSRRQTGSSGWESMRHNLSKTSSKLANIREDKTHKSTSHFCYDVRPYHLLIQDWDMSYLMEHGLNGVQRKVERKIKRRMQNANIGAIKSQLKYKAEWAEIDVLLIPEEVPVSKRCSKCGWIDEDLGGSPIFHCEECGYKVGREKNAIENYWIEYDQGNTIHIEDLDD